jgi:hypothetical protein
MIASTGLMLVTLNVRLIEQAEDQESLLCTVNAGCSFLLAL